MVGSVNGPTGFPLQPPRIPPLMTVTLPRQPWVLCSEANFTWKKEREEGKEKKKKEGKNGTIIKLCLISVWHFKII